MQRGDVRIARPPECRPRRLLDVLVDELGHLEHRHLALATKHWAELVVGVDHATFLLILEAVSLDVAPELLRDLGAGYRIAADHRREHRIWLLRRHERRIRYALRAALLGGLLRATLLRSTACAFLRAAF